MFMHHGAIETHRDNAGRTSEFPAQEYRRNGAPEVAGGKGKSETDASKREEKAKAILRSLARGPAFRSRSFLWPRAVGEGRDAVKAVVESGVVVKDKDRRPWTVRPVRAQGGRKKKKKKKPFSFAATVSRYVLARLSSLSAYPVLYTLFLGSKAPFRSWRDLRAPVGLKPGSMA